MDVRNSLHETPYATASEAALKQEHPSSAEDAVEGPSEADLEPSAVDLATSAVANFSFWQRER